MRKFNEWYMPDNEHHLQKWMDEVGDLQHGRLVYQGHKYRAAMQHCREKRTALDVGAHIGLWSFQMAHDFERVVGFEPMAEYRECWVKNLAGHKNCELLPAACGLTKGWVKLKNYTEDSSGDTRVSNFSADEKPGYAPLVTVDSYGLQDVDFMKVDCEGYELFVLQGAEETLLRCKPVVVVEQKRDMSSNYQIPPLAAVHFLKVLGAELLGEVSGDYFLGWK